MVFTTVYFIVANIVNPRVSRYGKLVARSRDKKVKLIQESLGGIRELIMTNNYSTYTSIYDNIDQRERLTLAKLAFLNRVPRILVESLFISVVISIGILITIYSSDQNMLIPTLGLFSLAAQKLLPNIQNIFSTWLVLKSSKVQIDETLKLLIENGDQKTLTSSSKNQIEFKKYLSFIDVSFEYPTSENNVFSCLNLRITKGEKVGIIGSSGSGKSTFIDLLTGLLEPTKGKIEIDQIPLSPSNVKSWHEQIAHVPQEIFVYDESFAKMLHLMKRFTKTRYGL